MTDAQNAPLEVYISYEYLPAAHAGRLLHSLGALYRLLLPDEGQPFAKSRYFYEDLGLTRVSLEDFSDSALCIEQSLTGNSITFKFAGRRQKPGIKWHGADLEVLAPTWTATALGVGALIVGSGVIYERYIDTQLKKSQIEAQQTANRLTEAQIEKTKAETNEIIARINSGTVASPKEHTGRELRIERHLENFYAVVNQQNIYTVQINGVHVKDGPNDDGPYRPSDEP